MPCHSEPMTARDALEVVRKGIIGLYDQQAIPDDSAQPKLDEALAVLSALVERAGEPVAAKPRAKKRPIAWLVNADSEDWITRDEDEADDNREAGFNVRPLIFGDALPPAAVEAKP